MMSGDESHENEITSALATENYCQRCGGTGESQHSSRYRATFGGNETNCLACGGTGVEREEEA